MWIPLCQPGGLGDTVSTSHSSYPSNVICFSLCVAGGCQPPPSGPDASHIVTCRNSVLKRESSLSSLVPHNPLPSLGPLASLPPGREGLRFPLSLATGWPILHCAFSMPPRHRSLLLELASHSLPLGAVVSCSLWLCWARRKLKF